MHFFGGIYKPWGSNRISREREKTHFKCQERQIFLPVRCESQLDKKGNMKGQVFKRPIDHSKIVTYNLRIPSQNAAKCIRIRAGSILRTHQTQPHV